MQRVADLHVHTNISDGSFPPEKVVRYAKSKGLSAISIVDHDTCDAIGTAIDAADDIGLEIIPGIELTAEMGEESELHILGYLIDWRDEKFAGKLKEIVRAREERAIKIIRELQKHGIDISEEELLEFSGDGCVGRLHIAHLLLKKGVIYSINEAFSRYIGNNGPCYIKKYKLSPKEAVELIKSAGGVAVLAHPKTINTGTGSIEEVVKDLVDQGIQGIEVYHSDHRGGDIEKFKKIAEKYDLLITGGSDCHGDRKKSILMGKIKIPYELVEKLKQAKNT